MSATIAKILNISDLLIFSLCLISGGFGGYAVAATCVIKGKRIIGYIATAYAILGAFFGLAFIAMLYIADHYFNMFNIDSMFDLMALCMLFGYVGASIVAVLNLVTKVTLKWKGMSVIINLRKKDRK
jgi:hypothetical protein